MYEYEESTEIMGSYCSLVIPYEGCSNVTMVGDLGIELVVHPTNRKEIVVYRDKVIIDD